MPPPSSGVGCRVLCVHHALGAFGGVCVRAGLALPRAALARAMALWGAAERTPTTDSRDDATTTAGGEADTAAEESSSWARQTSGGKDGNADAGERTKAEDKNETQTGKDSEPDFISCFSATLTEKERILYKALNIFQKTTDIITDEKFAVFYLF